MTKNFNMTRFFSRTTALAAFVCGTSAANHHLDRGALSLKSQTADAGIARLKELTGPFESSSPPLSERDRKDGDWRAAKRAAMRQPTGLRSRKATGAEGQAGAGL